MPAPRRAHELICKIGADTVEELVGRLEAFARDISRGEISHGCSGGYGSGTIYSYTNDPTMTHDRYFQELNEHLENDRQEASRQVR